MENNSTAKAKKAKRGAPTSATPWKKIQLRYVTGEDRPSYCHLAREFGLAYSTVQGRSSKENWRSQREKHRNNVIVKAQQKIEKMQSIDLAKSVQILEGLIAKMVGRLNGAGTHSIESLAREIRETVKTLNVYLDRAPEKPALDEAKMEKLAKTLLKIKEKMPEEYAELKWVYENGGNGGGK
ncbi:MAG: hypothetical protein ABIH66_06825 [bacterium]